jgi:hypothetical protein
MHVTADPSLKRAADAGKVDDLARALDPPDGVRVRGLLDSLIAESPDRFRWRRYVKPCASFHDRSKRSSPMHSYPAS